MGMHIRFANARRTLIAPAALLAALTLGACTNSPHRVVVAAREVKLSELVNSRVEFTGVVQGPGELGDYITISGHRVYLESIRAWRHLYNRRIIVDDELRTCLTAKANEH